MKRVIRIVFITYLFWFLLVVFFNLNGNISFGHGLGDLYYLLFIVFLTVLALVFYLRMLKPPLAGKTAVFLFVAYLIAIVISFSLKLTLYRGPEFPWNENLFL